MDGERICRRESPILFPQICFSGYRLPEGYWIMNDVIEHLLNAYEVDVRYPDVSGMEHLNMLQIRSELARYEDRLSQEQQRRLLAADQLLMRQADRFFAAIQRIADLVAWREEEGVTPKQWWWYLDVIARLPMSREELKRAA